MAKEEKERAKKFKVIKDWEVHSPPRFNHLMFKAGDEVEVPEELIYTLKIEKVIGG